MDTILRTKLISWNFSLVYVLALFGHLGVIYGPVIMAVFVTSVEVYLKYCTTSGETQPA